MTPALVNKDPAKLSVFIVDDHSVLREGLTMVINEQPDLVVCGEAADGAEALRGFALTSPDAAIVDLSLPDGSGLDLIKQIRSRFPAVAVLVLSMHDEVFYTKRVRKAGAQGYVMKHASTTELLGALRAILRGDTFFRETVETGS